MEALGDRVTLPPGRRVTAASGVRRAPADQCLVRALGARARHRLLAEEGEAVDELREPRAGEADDGLGGRQVGRLAAAVAAHGEVQALLDVRDDGGVDAGRLQHGGAAGQALAAAQVHLGEQQPHELLRRALDDHDVGERRRLGQRAEREARRRTRARGRSCPGTSRRRSRARRRCRSRRGPCRSARAGVSGLKPKALAAAGQASSSASRTTRSPRARLHQRLAVAVALHRGPAGERRHVGVARRAGRPRPGRSRGR